uniref:Uncharacterized protein n=1 Tax=Leersia perrieri TaxID=77586 RepID=A0A0D9W7S3_9ORYZ
MCPPHTPVVPYRAEPLPSFYSPSRSASALVSVIGGCGNREHGAAAAVAAMEATGAADRTGSGEASSRR